MPLTPEDVRNKRFTPVRLREGYDMGEVDQFLDEVEAELERLTHENEDLRQKLATAQRGEAPSYAKPAEIPQEEPAPAPPPAPVQQQPVVAAGQQTPASMAEASTAAARLLEIATQNADQLVAEAKEQANRIVSEARAKGERTENEARGLAARLESDARQKSEAVERETADRRNQLFGQLEKDKVRLEREIEELRAHERQFRSRLKAYFEGQLRALNNQGPLADNGAGTNGNGNGAGHEPVGATRAISSHKPVSSSAMSDRSDRYDRIDRSGSSTPRLNALLDEDDESSL